MTTFNKDILLSWSSFQNTPVMWLEIGNQHLWHNTNIATPNGTTLYSHRLSKLGINQVMDLIENQKIISMNDIDSKNLNFLERLELSGVVKCIPKQWKEYIYNQELIDFLSFNVRRKSELEKETNSRAVYKQIIQK